LQSAEPTARIDIARPWLVLVPLVLAVLAHLPAFWSGLVWDDHILVDDQLPRIESLVDVLQPPAAVPNWSDTYYRPLVTLSFLLDLSGGGEAATALAHATNLLLHVLATWLVWLLARRVLGDDAREAALVAAALFAVHPLHVESVNWICARTDVLSTLFVVAAGLAALGWRDRRSTASLVAAALFVLLALGAKEVGVVAALLLPALLWLAPRPAAAPAFDGRAMALGAVALLLPLTLYAWARQATATGIGDPLDLGPLLTLVALGRSTAWYLLKIALPWPMQHLAGWGDLPSLIGSGLILLATAAAGYAAIQRWRRQRDGVPLLGLLWFLLALAPALWVAISFGTRAPVAERYAYLPSVGAALLAGWAWARLADAWLRAALLAGIAAFTAGAFAWGLTWSEESRLWAATAERAPGNVFAWHSLARAHRAAGRSVEARAAYLRGLDADADSSERAKVMYGLAELDLAAGDRDGARSWMRRSRSENPQFLRAGYGLDLLTVLTVGSDRDAASFAARAGAIRGLRNALIESPDFHEARVALAQALHAEALALDATGRHAEALATWRQAIGSLDDLEARMKGEALTAFLAGAEPGLERDVPAYRARIWAAAGAPGPRRGETQQP